MEQVKNFQIFVDGRVQGVGYRVFALKAAKTLGLNGWVRNLLDGRVEVRINATGEQLEILKIELQRGPPFSKVKNLTIQQLELEIFEGFDIGPDEVLTGMAGEKK